MINEELRKTIYVLINRYPCADSAILPSLTLIQDEKGYVSESDMEELAKIIQFPEARIFSVASFYSMVRLKEKGRYHIQVCTNVSCSLIDGENLFEHISGKLGIANNETTPDGLFSLEAAECLGSCGYAPAMMINSDHYEGLSHGDVDEIIEGLKKKN